MAKSALGIFFTVLCFLFTAPALADEASATSKIAKKNTVGKNVAKGRVKNTAAAKSNSRMVKKVAVRSGKRMGGHQRVAYTPADPTSAGDLAGLHQTRDPLALESNVALVLDQSNSQILFEKNANVALPIASITKLMTALVVVEAHQNMDELLEVTADDIDREKNSSSRLRVGAQLTRANMLHIALMSSENRAASALGRNYPGGLSAFVAAMNEKAKALEMTDAHYVDTTGLSSHNVASARDLAKLVMAAYQHPVIRQYSTDSKYVVDTGGHLLQYVTSNRLVASPDWDIGLQKTGYISEAGRCLVMQTKIENRPVVMVFLDSKGKQSRLADAGRIRKWLEAVKPQTLSNVRLSVRQS